MLIKKINTYVLTAIALICLVTFCRISIECQAGVQEKTSPLSLDVKSSVATISPQQSFWLNVKWYIAKDWYMKAPQMGPDKEADETIVDLEPKITFDLPKGMTVGQVRWSQPKVLKKYNTSFEAYENEAVTSVEFKTDKEFTNTLNEIKLAIEAPVCSKVCTIEKIKINFTFPTTKICNLSEIVPQTVPSSISLVWLLTVLLFAFLGGIILNAMPCVFPVLALKIMHFASLAGKNTKSEDDGIDISLERKHYCLGYTAGVMASMILLSSVIYIFKAMGYHLGWGFQLQSPAFIMTMTLIFLSFALNLFGVFEMGSRLQSAFLQHNNLNNKNTSHPYVKHFFSGVLACIVATPCSAPFMGTAISVAFTQSYTVCLLIFGALGLGLAFPVLGILFFPKLLNVLPRPGAWMVTLRTVLGFGMLATVLWMLWIFNFQAPSQLYFAYLLLWTVSFLLWIYGKYALQLSKQGRGDFKKDILALVILAFASGGVWHIYKDNQHSSNAASIEGAVLPPRNELKKIVKPYSSSNLQDALKAGKPVLVYGTAKWCLTCQVNAVNVYQTKVFQEWVEGNDVIVLEADWTDQNLDISAYFSSLGQFSIPLMVFYPPHKSVPIIKNSLISLHDVYDLLKLQQTSVSK